MDGKPSHNRIRDRVSVRGSLWLRRTAGALREMFDHGLWKVAPRRQRAAQADDHLLTVDPALVVLAVGALAGLGAWAVARHLGPGCTPPPVSLLRLEAAYSAETFASLLSAEGACRDAVAGSFLVDVIFAATYPLLLSAVYLWAERWRRYAPTGLRERQPDAPLERRHHFAALAPIAAGLCDLVENAALWWAAQSATPQASAVTATVIVGSLAATMKWLLLLAWAVSVAVELLSGPRGLVLRRLRFSVLAVALGALPLLLVPQGRDILQRLVEGEHPTWRIVAALLTLSASATAVWYCGRKLLQLRLEPTRERRDYERVWRATAWYREFAEHTPRVLGIAILALAGAAFAREGLALGPFIATAVAGVVLVTAAGWRWPRQLIAFGRRLTFGDWARVRNDSFYLRLSGAVLATSVASAGLALTTLITSSTLAAPGEDDATRQLRYAGWSCLVLAWVFYLLVARHGDHESFG